MHDGAQARSTVDTRPDPSALASWRVFLRAHAVTTRRLEAELCDWPGPMLDLSATLDDADLRQ